MIGFPKLFAFFCFFQSRQPVFVRLLRGAFRLSQCSWMSGSQKYHVETCIKTLSDVGECGSFVLDTLNPLTPTISFVILLIVCHTILMMSIWRI